MRSGSCNNCARRFPEAGPYRYVILDRDVKFDAAVITFLSAAGLKPKRTSLQSPSQNGTAERWIGSCRRQILDHVIALDERHLLRLVRDYVSYYHQDRIHDSLEKDTPDKHAIDPKPAATANVTPEYKVYRMEIDKHGKKLKLWVRRKKAVLKLICSRCGQHVPAGRITKPASRKCAT